MIVSENFSLLSFRPLVSIIIPTYNRENLLPDAVRSCLEQSYPDIEIIIVDDGSTDGTFNFVSRQIQEQWKDRVLYCRQENAGASSARNKGLEIAQGKYVQFLDSDDILYKDKIFLQVRELEATAGDPVCCSCYGVIGSAGKGPGSGTRRIGVHCETPIEYIRQLSMGVVHAMQTSAPLWLRSFLITQKGWRTDISLGDDLEYYVRLLVESKKICFVAESLFLVSEHEGPQLSNARFNRPQILSAIRAHSAIVDIVTKARIWDRSVQSGILKKARTFYANILECGTREDILGFERWIKELTKVCHCHTSLPLLMCARVLLGRHALLLAHRFVVGFKSIAGSSK